MAIGGPYSAPGITRRLVEGIQPSERIFPTFSTGAYKALEIAGRARLGFERTLEVSIEQGVTRAMTAFWRKQEDTIRELLGRWVSELEPVVIFREVHPHTQTIVGLGMKGDPTGTVAVRV